MRTRTVNPDTVAPPAGNYSHAVRLELDGAALVFVSGQLPLDRQGKLVGVSRLVVPEALLEVEAVAAVATGS